MVEIIATFALTCATSVVQAQCTRYTVHVPKPLGMCGNLSESTSTTSISHQGDLVGEWSCAGGNERAMVAWNAQQVSLVPLPNTSQSIAQGITSNATIVGTRVETNVGYRGFTYHNGQFTDLEWLPGHNWAEAYSASTSDIVVGFSANVQTGPMGACRWIGADVENIPLPIGPSSSSISINNRNQIVGWMGVAPTTHFFAQAFLWEDGNVTELPMPQGATNSTANSISDNGWICGYYSIADPQGAGGYKKRALAWLNGEMVDLGTIPGLLSSLAFDVNDAQDIVGYCQNPPLLGNDIVGFIWRGGVMKQLDSLIVPNPNEYSINTVYGININGQIAANLGDGKGAARLDPIPPRPGDTNCDWLVNVTDLLAVINAWGPAPPQVPFEGSSDLNTDGNVNVLDLLAVINDWG